MNGYNLDLQGSPGLYRNGTQKSFVLMGKGKASMWVQVKHNGDRWLGVFRTWSASLCVCAGLEVMCFLPLT